MTSRTVNKEFDADVFFKCENLQRSGAFKFRCGQQSRSSSALNHTDDAVNIWAELIKRCQCRIAHCSGTVALRALENWDHKLNVLAARIVCLEQHCSAQENLELPRVRRFY
jgi:hypothetical protein